MPVEWLLAPIVRVMVPDNGECGRQKRGTGFGRVKRRKCHSNMTRMCPRF